MLSVIATPPAAAQPGRCADCHYANAPRPDVDPFLHGHVSDWRSSVHAQNDIGCEHCHGGDATTFDSFRAHLNLRRSDDPTSPINRRNLPATCGRCHAGPYGEFQKSAHYAALAAGNSNVPICTTCHGPVVGEVPSAKALEGRCRECHGTEGVVPRPLHPIAGRVFLDEVRRVRLDLETARKAVERVKNAERRRSLAGQWQQAEVPLIEAIQSGHQFKLADADERLTVARGRAGRLLIELQHSERQ